MSINWRILWFTWTEDKRDAKEYWILVLWTWCKKSNITIDIGQLVNDFNNNKHNFNLNIYIYYQGID